jgi:hypothetical protein
MRIKLLIIILIKVFLMINYLYSQKNGEISIGSGFPELLNYKIRIGKNFQAGGGLGFVPFFGIKSLTFDCINRFHRKTDTVNNSRWHINTGFTYIPASRSFSNTAQKFIFAFARLGISVYLKKKINSSGFNFDLGLLYQAWTNVKYSHGANRSGSQEENNSRSIGVGFNISYFFKI